MRAGTQFLIAARLLSTVRNLSAHLTLAGRESQLHLYCLGTDIVYLEIGTFPQSWLRARGETVDPSLPLDKRLADFRRISQDATLRSEFREAAGESLIHFFQGEVLECRMKQEGLFVLQGIMTLGEVVFDCGRPFVHLISTQELLGNRDISFHQTADFLTRSSQLRISSQEGYLLSRLETPHTVSEIISTVPGDEEDHKRSLLLFWAFGLLDSPVLNQLVPKVDSSRDISREAPAPAPPPPAASSRPTPPPPQAAPAVENAEELANLVNQTYQSLSRKDFYTLLDVTGRADLGEIKSAYYKLARTFHPDRFYGIQNPVLKEKVDIIFSAINVAYETLKNSKRRLEYDNAPKETKTIRATTLNSENTKTELTKETISKVAEEHFQRAQKSYEEGSYYQAVQFLRSATQIAPGVAKYWRQLGISLSRNPQWRKEAEDSFQRAMDLEPRNPENHLYLGFLYKNSGLKLRAKKHFTTCRDMDPSNEIAARELHLLEGEDESEQPAQAKKGLLGNIFKKK